MRLISGRLVNVCQHKDVWLKEMSLGITAITGPNGSGKSNLLNAMGYLNLTGDYSRCPNGKAGLPRRASSPVKSSYSESVWEHNGHQFLLRRSFLGTGADKTVLEVAGQSYTKAAEIQEQLRLLLGCTQSVFDHVFVPQWGIFKCLVGTEAERTRDFATLCGTEHCETIWEVLGEQLAKDEATLSGTVISPDVLRLSKLTADADRAEKKQLIAQRDAIKAQLPSAAKLEKAKTVVQRYEAWQQVKADGEARRAAVKQAEEALAAAKQAVADALTKRLKSETAAEAAERTKNQVSKERDAFVAWQQGETRILGNIEKNLPPVAPVRPTHRSLTLAESRQQLAIAQAECQQLEESVQKLEGQSACPTCHQTIEDPADLLAHFKQTLREAKSQRRLHKEAVADLESYETLSQRYEASLQTFTARKEELEAELREHRRKKPVERTAGELASSETVATQKRAAANEQVRIFLKADTAVAVAESNLQNAQTAVEQYNLAATNAGSLASFQAAKKLLDGCQTLLLQLSEIRGQLKAVRPRAEQSLQAYQDNVTAYRKQKPQQQWLSSLRNARDIVHRNNLPKLVHEYYMRKLAKKTNSILTDIDDPFVLEVVDGVNLQVRKSDGDVETVAGLSGGEKALLAIAYRLAEVSIFAGDLGMLVLDEPTAGLDADRLEKVAGAIRKLSGVLRKRGTQLLLVTHEPRLAECCDAIVSLER